MKQKIAWFVLGCTFALLAVGVVRPLRAFAPGTIFIRKIDMTSVSVGASVTTSDPLALSCVADGGREICFVATR